MKVGLVIAAIMICSIFPVSAFAAPNGKGKPEWVTYEQQKEQFEQAREQFRNRVINENQFTFQVQKYVDKSIDKIDSIVSKVRARVNASVFDQFLNQTRLRLWNATNKSEIIDIVKNMNHGWKDFKIRAKWGINQDISGKLNGIILNANGLARKINATIQQLDAKGVDTSSLKAELAQFNAQINIAYGNWTMAHELLKNYSNASDKEAAMDQAHAYLRNSHEALKQAHQILKNMVREIKGLIGKPLAKENETDTKLPNLMIISPLHNQTVSGMVDVNVSASDNTNITSVTFKAGVNGTLLNMSLYYGNISDGRWYALWDTNTTPDGATTISITATDYYNNSREISIGVYVNNTG